MHIVHYLQDLLQKKKTMFNHYLFVFAERDDEQKTLFVKNLNTTVTEKKLKSFFPDVESVRMPKNEEGAHKG